MAIKIIREGIKRPETITVFTFTCPKCGCVFDCTLEDFKYHVKEIGGDKAIDCPCCKTELHTNKNFYTIREEPIHD